MTDDLHVPTVDELRSAAAYTAWCEGKRLRKPVSPEEGMARLLIYHSGGFDLSPYSVCPECRCIYMDDKEQEMAGKLGSYYPEFQWVRERMGKKGHLARIMTVSCNSCYPIQMGQDEIPIGEPVEPIARQYETAAD